jgi:hypothetical protein
MQLLSKPSSKCQARRWIITQSREPGVDAAYGHALEGRQNIQMRFLLPNPAFQISGLTTHAFSCGVAAKGGI